MKSQNNENLCPIEKKRAKTTNSLILKKAKAEVAGQLEKNDTDLFEQMGLGMLESDETSSSSAASVMPTVTAFLQESSENEITPSLSVGVRYHPMQDYNDNHQFDHTLESEYNNSDETINNKYFMLKNFNNNFVEFYGDTKVLERKQAKYLNSKNHQQNSKGRSPLAAVACNNNLNIHQRPSTSNLSLITSMPSSSTATTTQLYPNSLFTEQQQIASLRAKQQHQHQHQQQKVFLPDENFFLYRNCEKQIFKENPFKTLSDEIILQIFKWLPKKTLSRCSFVCRKFNQLAQDESLWTRLDLGGKLIRSGSLGEIVSRGVVILRLAQSEIIDPVIDPERLQLCPEYRTKIQYLDLSMAVISKSALSILISKCNNLKKLSLEHVPLNDKILDEISKNNNLESLNLTMCEGIEQWSLKKMLNSLENLHSLNISWTFLNVEAISSLVQNLTSNLLRLNLAGCRKNIFDSHITTLTKKCPGLLELDLSDCTGLTSSAIPTICKFKELNYLSLSRCYGISASNYVELKKLHSLAYLDVFGILSDSALILLQSTFPNLSINKFIHSCVARPTVGTRRTSVWGLRTRD